METKFLMSDTSVSIIKLNEDYVLDQLPAQVYTLRFSEFTGFYLEMTKDKLQIPYKIYGETPRRVEKCIKTYVDRSTSTGILLTGDKGTGKTLLMSVLANEVIRQLELPVILIKDAFKGAAFTTFIELIGECCLVFDEFGKMYTADNNRHGASKEGSVPQKSLLSLMDGVDKTKRLIVMTENREWDINEFMLNRPSRVFYHFRYTKLDEGSITGYCSDNGITGPVQREIVELSRRTRIFSFDMLQSIVEEHNRFGSSIEEVTADLNIDISEESEEQIEIVKVIAKDTDTEREVQDRVVSKPGRDDYTYIKIKALDTEESDCDDEDEYDVAENVPETGFAKISDASANVRYTEFYFQQSDLKYEKDGQCVYDCSKYTVIAKDVPRKDFKFSGFLA